MIHRLAYALVLVVGLSSLQGSARAAEIQKSGSEQFPGKFAVGVYPLGWQVAFDSRSTGGYKFAADFAAVVKSMDKLSLWLGGGLTYAHPSYSCGAVGGCGHDIGFEFFVRLTMEKLLRIPLVPYVQAGIGGDILAYDSANIGGGVPIKLGGGVHYFILKNLGLGVYTNFAFGPGIYPVARTVGCGGGNSTCVGFLGYWDLGFGAQFAF